MIPKPPKPEKNKQMKINLKANQELKRIYREKGINRCEVNLPNCMIFFGLSFAHRHKRIWYKLRKDGKELLASFNETVLACARCHFKMESDKKLTEEIFLRLRAKE